MRRIATLILLLAGASTFAGAGRRRRRVEPGNEYYVELDNAFGLIEGGDLKIAGVRAGKITQLKLDRRTKRAIVGIQVTRDGFGSLRTDATCATRPQSLIGEYFLDCQPGSAPQKLPADGRIPVERTEVTVGPDLVNTVLRRPYRERLSIIINELGAAVAGNEENLNDAIRRASPALRETDKVLKKLAGQNRTLVELTENADTVIGDLDENREDVGRWVTEAGGAARTSASRKAQLAEGFRRLPAFLDQLEPTMRQLGGTVEAQTPALRDLRASAAA
jgi:ABC-type transporter Mla subunit MlaD